jgi:hypothetical protein
VLQNRVYIASKVGPMEQEVRELKEKLVKLGFQIIYDWTELPVMKPFEEHIEEATLAAENMARAVMECDILVVLFAKGGIGFHIETGGALVASIIQSFIGGEQKKKKIYIVGDGNDKSIFYFHKSVRRLPDTGALLEELTKL